MNDKLQYATMLEIPVSTCNVTFKPVKKKKFFKKKKIDHELVKKELLDKINFEQEQLPATAQEEFVQNEFEQQELDIQTDLALQEDSVSVQTLCEKPKKPFKISFIGVQLAIIGALILTIFLTNAVYPQSGVNVFLRNVFGTQSLNQTDDRIYADFSPVINLSGQTPVIADGVMSFSGECSIYAPCDGKITALTKTENGKFNIEITHSENFKSVLTGIDFAYAGLYDKVYHTIPVGYVTAGATMCFKGVDDAVISDYQIIDDTVVWAV
jgi:hypothetical protein